MPTPRLSIGLPVYNGERFLAAALESLRAQTFTDFEVVISDNGSTDATERICREYAERDPRIRYHRRAQNRGASWNYNRVFELASGEYFKWAAHDDVCAPDLLRRSVEVLDADRSVVLCSTMVRDIDEHDAVIASKSSIGRADSASPHVRFRHLIAMTYLCEEVFGVIRRDVLAKTALIGGYSDSDRVLLAELGLHGRFHEVPEELFLHRVHAASSVEQFPDRRERTTWFDARGSRRLVFPYWRQFREYLAAIRRSGIAPMEQLRCVFAMAGWLRAQRRALLGDLVYNARLFLVMRVPYTRTLWRRLRGERGHA